MDKQFVWQKVGKIVTSYPVMECDRCAIAVSDWLRKNEIPYKILRLRTISRNEFFIVSSRYSMNETITENGTHYGVEVYSLVFDNLSSQGLPRDEWIKDFNCRSGQFVIDELNFIGG